MLLETKPKETDSKLTKRNRGGKEKHQNVRSKAGIRMFSGSGKSSSRSMLSGSSGVWSFKN